MKIRIASRSGDESGELEVPGYLHGFLTWLSKQGMVTVTPPGEPVTDTSWGGAEPHPELWTIYMIDEYD